AGRAWGCYEPGAAGDLVLEPAGDVEFHSVSGLRRGGPVQQVRDAPHVPQRPGTVDLPPVQRTYPCAVEVQALRERSHPLSGRRNAAGGDRGSGYVPSSEGAALGPGHGQKPAEPRSDAGAIRRWRGGRDGWDT